MYLIISEPETAENPPSGPVPSPPTVDQDPAFAEPARRLGVLCRAARMTPLEVFPSLGGDFFAALSEGHRQAARHARTGQERQALTLRLTVAAVRRAGRTDLAPLAVILTQPVAQPSPRHEGSAR